MKKAHEKAGGIKFALSLIFPCVLLIFTIFRINSSAVESLLVKEAAAKSIVAAQYFERYLPDRKAMANLVQQPNDIQTLVAKGLEYTGIVRFKRYDEKGIFIFDSGQMNGTVDGDDQIGDLNSNALLAAKLEQPQVALEIEIVNGKERLIAETYVPVMTDGKVIGVAEIYSDQTANAAMFHRTFGWYSGFIAVLASLGFAIPAVGFFVRNRQKIAADDNVQFLATHDALTALHNRTSFNQQVESNLKTSLGKGEVAILHFIDLDGFKEINDREGHLIGDEVLRIIAERLQHTLRAGDIAARFGGDEFVVAQFGFTTNEQIHAATARVADVFKHPLQIEGKQMHVTSSIGTAVAPQHGKTAEELVNRADTSVYVVKSRGRNAQCYFEPRFDEAKQARLKLEDLVRKAVAAKSFHLNYQPLINFATGEIKGFEALLRLRDGNGKAVSPAEFIPVAEEIGVIDQIGSLVMEQACLAAATWPKHLQVSVNLSVAQFRNRSVLASTKTALAKSYLEPQRLLLEITESLLMTDTESILEQLRALKALGASIVMDDFGTGYSSLGYMLKFPFDRIKIDRSFVAALTSGSAEADNIVETIITLGHSLKMSVTAEGVETAEQANRLRAMKCDDAQGFYFGRPIPGADIPALLLKAYRDKNMPDAKPVAVSRQLA
jgi:diguanylate cyclase (GGDEF)-like protein